MNLSVIIPCLNAEATLAQQLEALASQQLTESWELLLADNGSTDRSIEIARTFEKRFAALRILNVGGSPQSAARARNIGVRAVTSEYLAFCDADDEVEPGWLSAMAQTLASHDVVCGKFRFDKFNDSRTANELAYAWKDGLFKGRFLPGGGSGNFGIKRWLHESIGGFDECLPHAEDADYFWRLQLEGYPLHYVAEAAIQIRVGRVNPSLKIVYRRNRNRFASNYWCYKRYRAYGMLPPPSLKGSLAQWVHTIKNGVRVGLQKQSIGDSWLRSLAQQTGELVGQIQGRLTNPCKPYHPNKTNMA